MAYKGILDIKEILEDYSQDIQDGITKEAIEVAKKGKQELKQKSPEKTGDYKKGWTVSTIKGKGYVRCTLHNKTDYQLTHLLEKPHKDRTGTKTIYPKSMGIIYSVEQDCIREYKSGSERIIKNGG